MGEMKRPYYLIPVSAKTKAAHQTKWHELAVWLADEGAAQSIQNIAFTLLVGRSQYAIRSALLVQDVADLQQQVARLLQQEEAKGDFYGELKRGASKTEAQQERLGETIRTLQTAGQADAELYRQALQVVAELYVQGYDVNGQELYRGETVSRISMPTYPFARNRYWVTEQVVYETAATTTAQHAIGAQGASTRLHPLLDANVSTIQGLCFAKEVSHEEFYLQNVDVSTGTLLPGTMFLEMARVAGETIKPGSRVTRLQQVAWSKPAMFTGKSTPLRISLFPQHDGMTFEVSFEGHEGLPTILCQGNIDDRMQDGEGETTLDLVAIQNRCTNKRDGISTRAIRELYGNEKEALARLEAPADLLATFHEFVLHPVFLEAALQTAVACQGKTGVFAPLSLGKAEMRAALPTVCYVHVTAKKEPSCDGTWRCDLAFAAEDGRVLATLEEFAIKVFGNSTSTGAESRLLDLLQRLERGELEIDEVDHVTEEILNG